MCPPTFFDVREVKNVHMRHPIDRELAQHQWENLRRALEEAGLQVDTIAPVKELEDMVFAANQVFVGESDKIGKFIVPSEMLSRVLTSSLLSRSTSSNAKLSNVSISSGSVTASVET